MDSNIVDREGFTLFQRKAADFQNQSFSYYDFEDVQNISVVRNDEKLLLLTTKEDAGQHLLWASNDPEELARAVQNMDGAVKLSFIPDDFMDALNAAGFLVHAEYDDYFNQDIEFTCTQYKLEVLAGAQVLNDENHLAVQQLSGINAGYSRGFDEEPGEWFLDWVKQNAIILLSSNSNIRGYCCVGRYSDVVWIRRLAVDKSVQGCGYGKQLLEQSLLYGLRSGARRGFLHVDRTNKRAVSLYRKYGFTVREGCRERIMIRKDRRNSK